MLPPTFDTDTDDLPTFPFTKANPLIVNRCNPVDVHVSEGYEYHRRASKHHGLQWF